MIIIYMIGIIIAFVCGIIVAELIWKYILHPILEKIDPTPKIEDMYKKNIRFQ